MNLRALPWVWLTIACAPAPPPPAVVSPGKPVAAAPERTRARWHFARTTVARAQWIIPGFGAVRVGESGRRWLVRTDGVVQHAETLLPADVVDLRYDGSQYFFIDARGDVHVASDPLGAFTTRPAPTREWAAVATGRDNIVRIDPSGQIFRSGDGGSTWNGTPLPLGPGETVAGIATDRKGNGLLLLHPQRLLLSRDDWATWKPLATPGIGAHEVARDGEDALWLLGAGNATAKLTDAWTVGGDRAPFVEPKGANKPSGTRLLAGDRIVTVLTEKKPDGSHRVSLRTEPLGGAPSEPFVAGETAELPSFRFTGAGSVVVGEISDKATTRVVRTTDDGRTWETIGSFPGHRPWSHNLVAAAGFVAIGELCDDSGKSCTPPRVRIGSGEWKPLDVPAKSRLTLLVSDPARERLLLIVDGEKLFRVAPTDASLTPLEITLPKDARILSGATLTGDGGVRLVVEDGNDRAMIVRIETDWKTRSVLYLPFQPDAIDLAGDRGLAFANHRAWETSDGGEHWIDVGAAFDDHISCSASGCLVGEAVRVGWDGGPGSATLTSTTTPPADSAAAAPGKELACTATGPWKTFPGELPYVLNFALDGDVRYLAEPPPDLPKPGATSVTVARGSEPPRAIAMLGPEPKGERTVRRLSRTTSDGYVMARYVFDPAVVTDAGKKYNPVDVELGWYVGRSGKVGRAKLSKLPPFRVGSTTPTALTAIVDDALLFMPYGADLPIHLLSLDGKVEKLPRPPKLDGRPPPDSALRSGARIALFAIEGSDVTLQWTDDNGKSWKDATWTMGHDSIPAARGLLLADRNENGEEKPLGLVPLDSIAADPSAMKLFPPSRDSVRALRACTALDGARIKHADAVKTTVTVTAKDGSWILTGNDSYARMRAEDACVAIVVARDHESEDMPAAVIAPHDLNHSWLLRATGEDPFQHQARPMTCALK